MRTQMARVLPDLAAAEERGGAALLLDQADSWPGSASSS
jgi:hypothetical protein